MVLVWYLPSKTCILKASWYYLQLRLVNFEYSIICLTCTTIITTITVITTTISATAVTTSTTGITTIGMTRAGIFIIARRNGQELKTLQNTYFFSSTQIIPSYYVILFFSFFNSIDDYISKYLLNCHVLWVTLTLVYR